MACNLPDWDWKKNDRPYIEGQYSRDYFDCGKYYFDGEFNVVEFPKDMALYNGSISLAMANLEFPLVDFYEQSLVNKPNTAAEKAALANRCDFIDNHFDRNINPAFFGDYGIARQYSTVRGTFGNSLNQSCGTSCIYAFKLKNNTKFLIMTDPYNIKKIIRNGLAIGLTANEIAALKHDYTVIDNAGNLPDSNSQNMFSPFHKVETGNMERVSPRGNGPPFYVGLKGLCRLSLVKGYAGVSHARSRQTGDNVRFAEVIMCNPGRVLIRNYENPYDWQYEQPNTIINSLKQVVKTMKKYKSLNLDWHGGDPYEHSVWTALHVENEAINNTGFWPDVVVYISNDASMRPNELLILNNLIKLTILGAFLHDIGKVGDGIYCYYDKVDHPRTGGEYLRGERNFLLHDGATNINLNQTLQADFPLLDIAYFAYIADIHYSFGNSLQALTTGRPINDVAREYILGALETVVRCGAYEILDHASFTLWVFCGIIVSVNDVKGGLPPNNDFTYIQTVATPLSDQLRAQGLTAEIADRIPPHNWNLKSLYFDFIRNRSKKYKGADNTARFRYNTVGVDLFRTIRDILTAEGQQIYAARAV